MRPARCGAVSSHSVGGVKEVLRPVRTPDYPDPANDGDRQDAKDANETTTTVTDSFPVLDESRTAR